MFDVSLADINEIIRDYGIVSEAVCFTELQRYHYEKNDPDSKEVRLILRVDLGNGKSVVMRFKNEDGVTINLIENQCRFADLLHKNGILTPIQYQSNGVYAKEVSLNGYQVIVCVEEFAQGEIKTVDETIAEKTGALLAKTHDIAERFRAHLDNAVLFDPFQENDLFFYSQFETICRSLDGEEKSLSERIAAKYHEYMCVLSPLKSEPRYAVQGDISDCNLYQNGNGEIGMFDFNCSGDNNLFCDAVMQAIFEARLMDYPLDYLEKTEKIILPAFLKGYQSVRAFTDTQKQMLPYLYAVVTSFWAMDIVWGENSLKKAFDSGDKQAIHCWLDVIWQRISKLPDPVLFY